MNAPVTGSMGLIWNGHYRVFIKCPKEIQYGHASGATGTALTKLAANEKMALPVGRPTYAKTTDGSTSQIEIYEL